MTKSKFEALSAFRYQLHRFFHLGEQLTAAAGDTNLQYLLLHINLHRDELLRPDGTFAVADRKMISGGLARSG